jgi:hypothetical protein
MPNRINDISKGFYKNKKEELIYQFQSQKNKNKNPISFFKKKEKSNQARRKKLFINQTKKKNNMGYSLFFSCFPSIPHRWLLFLSLSFICVMCLVLTGK